ncbi:MAG: glycosyltransferase [Ilumatobacteraceae bacterium]
MAGAAGVVVGTHGRGHGEGKGVSIVIPFKTDDGPRATIFQWVTGWWQAALPAAELIIEHSLDEPFCLAAARNRGAARATGDVIVIADADMVCEREALVQAVAHVRRHGGWALPYDVLDLLDEPTTAAVLATPPDPSVALHDDGVAERNPNSVSGVVVVPRDGWTAVHGQDERFLGWGYEDLAFQQALDTLWGPLQRIPARLVHLHHPRSLGTTFEQPLAIRSRRVLAQYHEANGSPRRMRRLVEGNWAVPGRGLAPKVGLRGAEYAPSLRVNIVLYENDVAEVRRCVHGLAAAVRYAQRLDRLGHVEIEIGDCSTHAVLSATDAEQFAQHAAAHGVHATRYHLFGANLGSAGGNNRLSEGATTDLLLMLNPDTTAAPNMLVELLEPLHDERVAITEARQVPFEHPKPFDPETGRTSWASGCCLLIRRAVFEAVGGYDSTTFPLYFDDVDLSWRVRHAGWQIVHAARAALFHDKRHNGAMVRMEATESQSSLLAQLLLAHKYARPDLLALILAVLDTDAQGHYADVRAAYDQRVRDGRLPAVLVDAARVADYGGLAPGGVRFLETV